MLPMTLAEVADVVGGVGARGRLRRGGRPRLPRQPPTPSPAGCSSRSWGSTPTGTSSPPAPTPSSAAGPPRRPRSWSTTPSSRSAGSPATSPAGCPRRCSRSPAPRARPAPRTTSPRCWRPPAPPSPPRAASTTSSACRSRCCARTRTPSTSCSRWVPAASATSPTSARSRRPASRRCSTSARPTSASSARARRSRWPRARSSRRCPRTGWPCSTPTTRWCWRWSPRTRAHLLRFGVTHGDVRARGIEVDDLSRPSFELGHGGAWHPVRLRQSGAHQVENALAAAAMARGRRRTPRRGRGGAVGRRVGLTDADGAARAGRRPARDQRRLQRQPGLDVGALETLMVIGEAARAAHRRGARRDARAGRPVARRPPGGRSAPPGCSASTRSWWWARRPPPSPRGTPARGRGVRRSSRRGVPRRWTWVRENVAGSDVVLVKASRGAALEFIADGLLEGGSERAMRAILLGGGVALLISLLGTRVAINLFTQWGYGQEIRDDGPTSHHTKRGTPTMGGVVIILATVIGYFVAKLITQDMPSASALLLLFLFVGIGAGRLPRRLHQDLQAAQPRPAQQGQDDRPDRRRAGLRRALALAVARGRPRPDAGVPPHLVHPRHRLDHAADRRGAAADLADHRGDHATP